MNYLSINNQKIELTEEQVKAIQSAFGAEAGIRLSEIAPGETFKVGEHEFFVLEHLCDETAVMMKELLYTSEKFGTNNNYEGSHVDELCSEFGCKIEKIVGEDNLVMHEVDLTSDDGLKDYGTIKRKMALITANDYRRWVEVIDRHKLDKWWWLSTAFSTPKHEDDEWVKCVSPGGTVDNDYYDYIRGVRPFCILKSNIFVSK